MRTTIEMAREAAGDDWGLFQEYMPEIHRLAKLVRADERNSWPLEMEAMERQVNILTDALAESRREVAAKDKALDLALEALEAVGAEFVCRVTHHHKKDQHGGLNDCPNQARHEKAITAIKQARSAPVQGCDYCNHPLYAGIKCKNCGAAPVQEPVATVRTWHMNGDQHAELGDWELGLFKLLDGEHTLYTTPPAAQRPFVGLTDEERMEIYNKPLTIASCMDEVEAKLRSKNNE